MDGRTEAAGVVEQQQGEQLSHDSDMGLVLHRGPNVQRCITASVFPLYFLVIRPDLYKN